MKTNFYVYVLQSLKDFSFYIGECADLDCRMSKHFDGWSKYTSRRGPWRLKYFEVFTSRTEAIKREKNIKSKKSKVYIQLLIDAWLQAKASCRLNLCAIDIQELPVPVECNSR